MYSLIDIALAFLFGAMCGFFLTIVIAVIGTYIKKGER